MNLFSKISNFVGTFLYGEIEQQLDKILEEIEKDKSRTEKLEKELQRARVEKERYKNLVLAIGETIPDMMWAKDLKGRYMYANKGILDGLFYSMPFQAVVGKNDIQLAKKCKGLVGEQKHTFGEICGNSDIVVLQNLKKERFLEWGLVNGKDMYLEVFKAPLFNNKGECVGTVGVGRDVTEWYLAIKNAVLQNGACGKTYDVSIQQMVLKELDKYKFEG